MYLTKVLNLLLVNILLSINKCPIYRAINIIELIINGNTGKKIRITSFIIFAAKKIPNE